MKRRLLKCEICGKKLTGRQQRYCCASCRTVAYQRRKRDEEKREAGKRSFDSGAEATQTDASDAVKAEAISCAAATGDQYRALVALRQKLATEIDLAEHPKDLATLASRFIETLDKIQAIDDKRNESKGGGALDEFTKRREARRAPAA